MRRFSLLSEEAEETDSDTDTECSDTFSLHDTMSESDSSESHSDFC